MIRLSDPVKTKPTRDWIETHGATVGDAPPADWEDAAEEPA